VLIDKEDQIMPRIVDLSLPLRTGETGVEFELQSSHQTQGLQTTLLHLFSHAGTHLDAPYHFLNTGLTLEGLDLGKCIGPAIVADLSSIEPRGLINVEHLAAYADRITPGSRLLLRTDWSTRAGLPEYRIDFPRVSLALAEWLCERRIALLGVEPPSVADMANREELIAVHQTLLRSEIVIVEGLTNLSVFQQDQITFIALPLKLVGGDGSPVRAIGIEGDLSSTSAVTGESEA
jgi:arylformamidase